MAYRKLKCIKINPMQSDGCWLILVLCAPYKQEICNGRTPNS
jgi:hypothetical protein